MLRIADAIRAPRVVNVAALVVVNRHRAPARLQHQRVLQSCDGDDAASCLCDKSLRRVRSWRAHLGDELPEGLVIDSIVEAEEATDACRDVAPIPGGEHALLTTHHELPDNRLSARPKGWAGKGVASAMRGALESQRAAALRTTCVMSGLGSGSGSSGAESVSM